MNVMTGKRSIPRYLWISLLVSVGGMLFGLDTGTIGPVTTMTAFENSFGTLSATLHGVVVSSILIPAAISSMFAGNVADAYGRPRTIMFGAAVFGIGAAIETAANKLSAFIVGRIITGFGEGFFLSILVVYVCEISPARRRGPLASLPQFLTTVGIAAGYFISYGTQRINSSASWRIPLAFQSFMALSFAVCCTWIPPSPRWLLAKGRPDEAAITLARLGVHPSEQEETARLNENNVIAPAQQMSLMQSIRATFKDMSKVFAKDVRKRTALGCFMMAMQQFSGIDGVLYYAPLLFKQAGLPSESATFLASGVSAIVILVVTIPGSIFSDHWGRRTSTLVGGSGLAATMLIIGSLYAGGAVHGDHGAGRWVVIVTIFLFAVIFSTTWAIGFKVYSSEIQPPSTRAPATSLAQSANWFANFVVALTTPVFLANTVYGAYYFFGACSLFTVIVCLVTMPETRGKTLEGIDSSFEHHSWLGDRGNIFAKAVRSHKASGRSDDIGLQSTTNRRQHLPTVVGHVE